MSGTRLVLWDVDSTLIRAGPFGRELYGVAFEQVTGLAMRAQSSTFGRLDPDIYRDTLAAHGLDLADHPFPAFAEALAAAYATGAARLREMGGLALPGAARALAALAGQPGTVQTVVTGNVEPVARSKLAAFGLDRHIDFEAGAYGTDGAVRAELVRVALLRASARHRTTFDGSDAVLIGDSHHDVVAGIGSGVRVIAVATGQDGAAVLTAHGAPLVLPDLRDTERLLRAIRGEEVEHMDGVSYRAASAADAGGIAALHAESWRRHYRGAYADAFLDGDVVADRRAVWSGRLASEPPGAVTIVAEVGGAIAGFVHVFLDDDERWGSLLDNLHVAHARQRLGIGSALLTRAAQAVADRGTTGSMYLWVLEQNTAAQAFYAAHGGRCAGRRLVDPPGGVPGRLDGRPAALRYVWADARALLRR